MSCKILRGTGVSPVSEHIDTGETPVPLKMGCFARIPMLRSAQTHRRTSDPFLEPFYPSPILLDLRARGQRVDRDIGIELLETDPVGTWIAAQSNFGSNLGF